jgi:hypothetical protein
MGGFNRPISTAFHADEPKGFCNAFLSISRRSNVKPTVNYAKRLCVDGIDVAQWAIMIDEVPNVLEQGQHTTPNSLNFLTENYDLKPSLVHQGLNEISFAPNHISESDVRRDDAHKGFANLHRHIQSGHSVYTTISSWSAEVDKSKKPWLSPRVPIRTGQMNVDFRIISVKQKMVTLKLTQAPENEWMSDHCVKAIISDEDKEIDFIFTQDSAEVFVEELRKYFSIK